MADSLLDRVPVVPVVVLHDLAHAVPVARALVEGGLPMVEVTLRTPIALEAIRLISDEVPDILVGAGTIVGCQQAGAAVRAGAQFLVSPGSTPAIRTAMRDSGVPSLPGVSTVSEALAAMDDGFDELKFFPAESAGGAAFLSSLASPLPGARFCPTGGITPDSAARYLELPNVGCVGGSWITPSEAMRSGDWDSIVELARTAAAQSPGTSWLPTHESPLVFET